MRAGIALGSNLGDRLGNLREARQRVGAIPNRRGPIRSSAIYETEAVNCEPGAPPFLNAVVELEYDGSARALLEALRAIESQLGRPVDHERNTSRTVDLDLLYLGHQRITEPDLEIPHPRLALRRFVLAPLADLCPDVILPEQNESVRNLLARLPDSPRVVRLHSEW